MIFEFTAITSIVVIAYVLYKAYNDTNYALQALTLIAVCSIRLIPSFNILTNAFTSLKSYQEIFDKFYNDVYFFEQNKTKKLRSVSKLSKFRSLIEFKNVSFRYPKTKKFALQNVNLRIQRGK